MVVSSSSLSGTFTSPEAVGLYDALQDASTNHIMQPLLVYGCITSSDCSNSWRLTAYGKLGSTIYYVTPTGPSQGDTIQGTITAGDYESCSGGSGMGEGYNIDADDVSSSSSVSLNVCTSDQYQDAVGGSLELQDLSTCTQMPGTTFMDFGSISWSGSGSTTEVTGGNVNFCSPGNTWYNSPNQFRAPLG